MQIACLQQCQQNNRPVFCINSPSDLICAAPWIERDIKTNQGTLKEGPGGPLYDFLQKNKNQNPVLLVNYVKFTANDIIRFNTLLDDPNPCVDGAPFKGTVIGFENKNNPDRYRGQDFIGRFKEREICPVFPDQLILPSLPIASPAEIEEKNLNRYRLNFFMQIIGSKYYSALGK